MQFTYWQKCSPLLSENTKLIILLVVDGMEGDFFVALLHFQFMLCKIKSDILEVYN